MSLQNAPVGNSEWNSFLEIQSGPDLTERLKNIERLFLDFLKFVFHLYHEFLDFRVVCL